MDGHTPTPNQWNPETPDDDIVFDKYMRELAVMTDDEYAQHQLECIPKPMPVPEWLPDGSNALDILAANFHNFLVENSKSPESCPFPPFTPYDARRYCALHPLKQGDNK